MMNSHESNKYSSALSIYSYPSQSFAVRSQQLIFSILVCNIDCRAIKNQYSYCFKTNVFLTCSIIIFVMSIKLIIDQIPSGQLSKQLIQDLDCSIALTKGFVLPLREVRLLKLNTLCTFLFKINYLLHQFTSMEFREVAMAIH